MEKRSHVEVSVKDQFLLLKSYSKHDCNSPEVFKEIKLAVVQENLAENVQQLKTEKRYEKIKMANQVQKLTKSQSKKWTSISSLRN